MRNGIVELLVVMSILWISASFIVGQKVYHEANGGCDKQPVLVPVLLDKECKPNIMLRKCKEASDEYKVECWI